ncbi:ribonuclease domain-containing protein [Embleya sp. AB8]|uniref:ribonuclease domain-containing protein n=1 Tax=Embleya sp. AB8 TaxID=3156304 RepID=UPI003C77356B
MFGARRRNLVVVTVLALVAVAVLVFALTRGGGGGSHSGAKSSRAPSASAAGAPATATAAGRPGWVPTGMRTVAAGQLPAEARETLRLIAAGGPYPYPRDGIVFGNREKLLPGKPNGYYHEYTVRTPGAGDRGARRIVTGNGAERFYSDDHYASFAAVLP